MTCIRFSSETSLLQSLSYKLMPVDRLLTYNHVDTLMKHLPHRQMLMLSIVTLILQLTLDTVDTQYFVVSCENSFERLSHSLAFSG